MQALAERSTERGLSQPGQVAPTGAPSTYSPMQALQKVQPQEAALASCHIQDSLGAVKHVALLRDSGLAMPSDGK